MDKDELQQQWQQELKKGRHTDRKGNKDLTPGSEIQSQLQDKAGIENNDQIQGLSQKVNQLAQKNFYRQEMNKAQNKEKAEGKRIQQAEKKMEDIAEGTESYSNYLDQNNDKDQNKKEKKLRGFVFALPFAALLDMLDFVSGFFDETVVVAIIRIIIEILASLVLFLWYVLQVGFSGRKQKKNMAKFVLGAVLDLIPIITFLPIETAILLLILADQKSGGKIKKAAKKTHQKTKEQKNNVKNNQIEAAGTAS